MNPTEENIKRMVATCDELEKAVETVLSAVVRLRRAIETLRRGLIVEAQITRGVVSPMEAPEITLKSVPGIRPGRIELDE